MSKFSNVVAALAAGVGMLALSAPASAVPVLCQVVTNNHMFVDSSQVVACVGAGVGNIGQGGGNDPFLQANPTLTDVSASYNLQFTQNGSSGTWSFDASAWDDFEDLLIGFKFGTGNQPDEWFVYSLQDLVSSGDWSFVNVFGTGGGLSHLVLYAGEERTDVPEPGTLGLLGLGLAGLGFGFGRRKKA